MGFSCSFLHNQTYTADDVNRAFSHLTTQGVSLFADTGDTLTDLNTAVSNLIENGVDLFNNDSCKVEKVIDGQYKVLPGTAFMPNGEAITVDTDGYTFLVDTGTALNVIMEVDANIGQIRTTTESTPTNGILLATIEADGTVTDKRTCAKTKVAPATANIHVEYTGEFRFSPAGIAVPYEIDVGWPGFSAVGIYNTESTTDTAFSILTDNVEVGVIKLDGDRRMYITKSGSKVTIRTYLAGTGGASGTYTLIFV